MHATVDNRYEKVLMGYHPGSQCVFVLPAFSVDGTLYLRDEDEKRAYHFGVQWAEELVFAPGTRILYLSMGRSAMLRTKGEVFDGGLLRAHSGAQVSLGRAVTPLDKIMSSGRGTWISSDTPCKHVQATYGGAVVCENDIPETTVTCFQNSRVVVKKAQRVRIYCAGSSYVRVQCNSCEGHETVEQGSRVVFERR